MQAAAFACFRLFILVFAFLICNTAAGFASRLAGGLAFATATLFRAFAEIAGIQSFNSFHCHISIPDNLWSFTAAEKQGQTVTLYR